MSVIGREGISRRRALCCLLALAGGTPLLRSAAAAPRVIKVHARKFALRRTGLRCGSGSRWCSS